METRETSGNRIGRGKTTLVLQRGFCGFANFCRDVQPVVVVSQAGSIALKGGFDVSNNFTGLVRYREMANERDVVLVGRVTDSRINAHVNGHGK